MSNMHYSLLDDPIITVRFTDDEIRKSTLPDIYVALLKDNILSFEALQPHQQQPWFSFLVQLAAMAIAREADGEIPEDPEKWKSMLISLADGSEAAWHLVVEDVSQPAFMQPPVPEGSLEEAGYKSDIRTPDELDMLVTSKNHDVKGSRILRPEPEYWLYALLTLQTMEGYSGKFNYGISRMNGGGGNRPFVGIATKLSWGERVKRDLKVLLKNRENILEIYKPRGHALLWSKPWDGKNESTIQLNDCDPYFIEICRRIRFKVNKDYIIALRATTKEKRIKTADNYNGITNDPWTPINVEDLKSLSLREDGFTYQLIQNLLLGNEFKKPMAFELQKNEQDGAYIITRALVRGGGVKTETNGIHKRIIPIPSKVTKLFVKETDKELFAKRAQERVALASDVQKKILNPVIRSLLSSGEGQRIEYEKIAPWINRFDQAIDHRFFESLWASVEMESDEARKQWQLILYEEAKKLLQEAERSIPIADLRRLRAVSQARSIFYGRSRDILDLVHEKTISTNQTEVNNERGT